MAWLFSVPGAALYHDSIHNNFTEAVAKTRGGCGISMSLHKKRVAMSDSFQMASVNVPNIRSGQSCRSSGNGCKR